MNKLITSLILALMAAPLEAQVSVEMPRLVVGITVDQLRTDYLEAMMHLFGEKGFKRLMNGGVVYENVTYDFPFPDIASATASVYTGTYPFYNGITGKTIYNVDRKRTESILFDLGKMGNFTNETVSPKNLLTSTIADELKIASDGRSSVYAIAPSMEQAILSGGHAANSVFWINEENGKWATTTYYEDIPYYVDNVNRVEALSVRIDTMSWVPMLPVSRYDALPYLSQDFLFKHQFSKYKHDKYAVFKASGLVNEEVTRLATTFIDNAGFGQRLFPDMLNIGYTAANFRGKSIQEYSLEMQDTYVRLDRALGNLLDAIDKKVGLKNTVIFLTSTGCYSGEAREAGSFGIPNGDFYPNRATALLNMYLMAIYGQGDWVEGYYNRQIFLNRKLITDQQISLDDIQLKAAEFLIQMTGVQDVITSHQFLHGTWNDRVAAIRRGSHRKFTGDLLIEIQPGWEIVHEDVNDHREYVRENAIPAPLFFFGDDLKPQHVVRQVKITAIAPTVARILRIRSPNAAKDTALPEVR
ncbi:alkaline phosphatase family protein [Coprobacter tertius]|uniref:Alkaline phosphatase family protein n=1 Tax=Coprobacter tertius TaxID=2944915 RepID=A0ABT1MGG3_9BACT|nr:alkaline phosphatase family protein [Coprobacter tertius]MCP9611459.1 alkaline phosphatase family protein [Coprobacter tertius]